MIRRLSIAVATVMLLVGLAPAAAGAVSTTATPAPVSACVVRIARLAFRPHTAMVGTTATLKLAARNCTKLPQSATVQFTASWVGPSAGLPNGCPVIDPLAEPASFAPHGKFTAQVGYLVPAGCAATALDATVQITGASGTPLATGTARLRIRQ